MEYQVVFKKKLTEVIDPDYIIGIIETSSHYGSKSLVITVKENYDSYPYIPYYGERNNKRIFIPLDRFTHHIPSESVLPREFWDNVQIIKKRVVGGCDGEFIKAKITKKVSW